MEDKSEELYITISDLRTLRIASEVLGGLSDIESLDSYREIKEALYRSIDKLSKKNDELSDG